MMKGWIALDIDGTLTDGMEPVPLEVAHFLRGIFNEGWKIVIATGRTLSFASRALTTCEFPYFFAVQNGADLLEMPFKRIVAQKYLRHDFLKILDEVCREEKEDYLVYAGVEKGDFCYFRPKRFSKALLKYFQKLMPLAREGWKEVDDFELEELARFPLVKCFGTEEAMRGIEKRLKKHPVSCTVIRDPLHEHLYLNMITQENVSKGKTLEELRNSLKKKHPIIAAGDDWNDLSLLEVADVKIVMETAPKELLAIADIIAKSSKERGIVAALQEAVGRYV